MFNITLYVLFPLLLSWRIVFLLTTVIGKKKYFHPYLTDVLKWVLICSISSVLLTLGYIFIAGVEYVTFLKTKSSWTYFEYTFWLWVSIEVIGGLVVPLLRMILNFTVGLLLPRYARYLVLSLTLLAEVIFLGIMYTFSYVRYADKVFDSSSKIWFQIIGFELFVYAVVMAICTWFIMFPYSSVELGNLEKRKHLINLGLLVLVTSGSFFVTTMAADSTMRRQYMTGSIGSTSDIDAIKAMDIYTELEAKVIEVAPDTLDLISYAKDYMASFFNEQYSVIDSLSYEFNERFRSAVLMDDKTAMQDNLKQLLGSNRNSPKEVTFGHDVMQFVFLWDMDLYQHRKESEWIIENAYMHLRGLKLDEKDYDEFQYYRLKQIRILIYYQGLALAFGHTRLAYKLYEDIYPHLKNLVVEDLIGATIGYIELAKSFNAGGRFHKAELLLIEMAYFLQKYNNQIPEKIDPHMYSVISGATDDMKAILAESIMRQRYSSEFALQLFREAVEKDDGMLLVNKPSFASFNYLNHYHRYYELAIYYVGNFVYMYPSKSHLVANDIVSLIEKNKSRAYKASIDAEWIKSPPVMSDDRAGLNYITTDRVILGQYYDSDTTISFSIDTQLKDYDLQTIWMKARWALIDFKDPINEIELLTDLLIPKDIRTRLENKHLYISPDNFLQEMPFQYLLDDTRLKSITIIPGFSYFTNQEQKAKESLLAVSVAKPNPSGNKVSAEDLLISWFREDEDSLLFAVEEARDLAAMSQSFMPGLVTHKNEATETWIKDNIANYDIIHFSTHSKANKGSVYKQPGVLLISDEYNDGLLSGSEINEMKLNGQFIMLSSCEGSIGSYEQGEGIMSIAKAFIDAGASGVIASLWKVNDKSIHDLSLKFYSNFFQGMSASTALYAAQDNYSQVHSFLKYPFIFVSSNY
jgi:hypothetical protein